MKYEDTKQAFAFFAWALTLCSTLVTASAAVIDDFTDGGLSIHPSGQTLVQSNLSSVSVLGGIREVYGSGTTAATLEVDSMAGVFAFDSAGDFGYFRLGYGTMASLGVDLRADGSDAFLLTFSDIYTPGLYRGIYELNVNGVRYNLLPQLAHLNGTASIKIPFSSISTDPTLVVNSIVLNAARIESGYRFVLDSITTIPEPSISLMLVVGLPFMAICTRHKRAIG